MAVSRERTEDAGRRTDRNAAELAHRWCEEVFCQGRLESVDALFHPDGTIHGMGLAGRPARSASAVKDRVEILRGGFPDLRMTPGPTACEGEMVAFVCTMSGTHRGDALGVPATGRVFEISGISMGRWRDGRLLTGWNYFDLLTFYRDLGVLSLFAGEAPLPISEDDAAPAPPAPVAAQADESHRNLGHALRIAREVYNEGRLETLSELFAPDCLNHDGGLAAHPIRGVSAFQEQAAAMRAAAPDLRMEVLETVAEGELNAYRSRITGTHTGQGLGMVPTGRRFAVHGISMGRWRGGRLVEGWNRYDLLELYRSLGLLGLFAEDPPGR